MKIKYLKNDKGFALLFSVLVSSLLLTIGLSIFNIALKELAISTSARQSIHAFYAADSGREYAVYHDTKIGDLLDFDFDSGEEDEESILTTVNLPITDDATGPYALIDMQKNWLTFDTQILTTLVSRGYDTNGDDRVERAIEQTY